MSIRIVHIGVGGRGRHWLEYVAKHPDYTAVGCVDVDQKALDSSRKMPGQEHGKFFTSLRDAVAQTEADAALVTSPSSLHAPHALEALDAGLAVLVEKPFGCNLAEAQTVVVRAREVGRPVMVAENFRFFQAERTLRRMLDDGMAGRIASVVCVDRRDQPSHTQGPWVKGMEHPFLREIAVHHFDSFRYLFSRQPAAVFAAPYNPPASDYDGYAAVNAVIDLDGGLSIQYSGTLVANRYEYSLWVQGDKGDIWTDRRRVWWRPKGRRFFLPVKLVSVPKGDEERYPKAGTVSILNQFRDAVIQGSMPETSGEDNLWTLAMVEAGILSAREGRKVRIEEVFTSGAPQSGGSQAGEGSLSPENKLSSAPSSLSPNLPGGDKGTEASKPRLLFIGLDAADTDLIEAWCREGFLPNISRMRDKGTWARMRTTAEIVHVSAWPSIFTGAAPDEHGLYHAYVMEPGKQSPVRPRPDQSPFPFLWKLLSDQGKRCIIMDAFMTCPLQNFNGTQIAEWGTWSWFTAPTISPESIKKEMHKKFGGYPAEDHSKIGMTPPPDPQGFHGRLLAAVKKKTQVVKWLMEKDWDFFLVVFGESHPAGHYFWHYHDESYIAHSKGAPGLTALRDVYVALDAAIGEIVQNAGEDTVVVLASGDGMGPNYSGSHLLSDLLLRMKLFNNIPAGANGAGGRNGGGSRAAKTDLMSTARNMIPKSLRVAVSRALLPRRINEKLSLRWKTAGIAWPYTRAFLIENANEGYIRINLKGREPEGVVEPGKDYDALCEEIYQAVKSATNPANGTRAAQTVYKTDDIYKGPCRSHMPDIIINWNDDAKLTTELLTEKYGVARSADPGHALAPYYTGNHRPTAFSLAVGPQVPRGRNVPNASIMDLAPTMLAYFGVTPPVYMEGKVLEEIASCQIESSSSQNSAPIAMLS